MYSATEKPQHATGIPVQTMTGPSQWSTGLCDFADDWSSCCLTCWCPCISFGRIAEVVDKGATSCAVHGTIYSILCLFVGCQCIYSCMYRSKLRQQYMLSEEPCRDWLLHCCCEWCALSQEYRELKNRGFEPSLGWEGNMAKQMQGIMIPPVAHPEMKR